MGGGQIDTDLIRKYVNRETTQEEDRQILDWLEESDDNRQQFADLLLNESLHSMLADPERERNEEEMLDRMRLRIDEDIFESRSRRRLWTRFAPIVSVAVACVALFLIFNPLRLGQREEAEEIVYQYSFTNTKQAVASVELGDMSKVLLKPGARILYNVSGLEDRRLVKLSGEAFFDVARDSLRPFIVNTDDIGVEVLGTAFSVSSGDDTHNTEVVLERGSVRILSPEGAPLVTIAPGQKAVFDAAGGGLRVESVNAVAYVAEKYNLITLNNATIAEIVGSIEDTFGVDIAFDHKAGDSRKFVFSYSMTDSVDDILSILEFISGVRLELQSTTLNQ